MLCEQVVHSEGSFTTEGRLISGAWCAAQRAILDAILCQSSSLESV